MVLSAAPRQYHRRRWACLLSFTLFILECCPGLIASPESNKDAEEGLVWQDLSVATNNKNEGVVLLHPCTGRIPAGEICGLLGPSGAGKSTFLRALAGKSGLLHVKGHVSLYHREHDKEETYQSLETHQVAWLQQHDDFFTGLTVEETLQLAAFLELPTLPAVMRQRLVTTQLTQLGLASVAHRQIGETGQGLSGGERRRLAVAMEVLTDKQIFLADEATSGLDASLSHKVMQWIQQVARQRNIPALCSLHAPRSSIWKLLDHVILLSANGQVLYCGPRSACLPYFARLGHPCPSETNPAEFLMDLISVETPADQARVDRLVQAFAEKQQPEIHPGAVVWREPARPLSTSSTSLGPLHVLRRFGALCRRSWRQNVRNVHIHWFRFVASAVNAVLLAAIFPSVAPGKPPSPASVADRVALLTFGAINMCFMAFIKSVTLLAEERPVVDREQTRGQYTALEYVVAKILAELPMDSLFAAVFTTVLKQVSGLRIAWKHVTATFSLLTTAGASLGFALGCWSPHAELGKTASVPIIVLLMVVGVINPSGVDPQKQPPVLVQWMKKFSPFAYAVEALCLGEYPGMSFAKSRGLFAKVRNLPKMGGLALVQNGDQVIEALGLAGQTYANAMRHLGTLSAGFLVMSWVGLTLQNWVPRLRRRFCGRKEDKPQPSTISLKGETQLSSGDHRSLRIPTKLRL